MVRPSSGRTESHPTSDLCALAYPNLEGMGSAVRRRTTPRTGSDHAKLLRTLSTHPTFQEGSRPSTADQITQASKEPLVTDLFITPAIRALPVEVREQLVESLDVVGYDGYGAPLFRWQLEAD